MIEGKEDSPARGEFKCAELGFVLTNESLATLCV